MSHLPQLLVLAALQVSCLNCFTHTQLGSWLAGQAIFCCFCFLFFFVVERLRSRTDIAILLLKQAFFFCGCRCSLLACAQNKRLCLIKSNHLLWHHQMFVEEHVSISWGGTSTGHTFFFFSKKKNRCFSEAEAQNLNPQVSIVVREKNPFI